jgi:hypothetical protein
MKHGGGEIVGWATRGSSMAMEHKYVKEQCTVYKNNLANM